MRRTIGLVLPLLPLLGAVGCHRVKSSQEAPKAPEVQVALPLTRQVIDHEDFTGGTGAMRSVQIKARATGFLVKAPSDFGLKEGGDVKEGDRLFLIDPRTYKASLAQAKANLAQAEAHYKRLTEDYERNRPLLAKGGVSREEFDKIVGDRQEAEAAVGVARAQLDTAQLNLDFTDVRAPFDGRISRQQIDPGNMVIADQTVLTTIVSLDPMYVYFDVDERTMLRLRRLVREGKLKSARDYTVPVMMGTSDEEGFPHEGTINFVDNQLDPGTGTLRVRAVVPNPDKTKLLSPGQFARVRIPIGDPHMATVVSERALGTDQGQKFVYVVSDKNEVEYRRVRVGSLTDGLREIVGGLRPDEKVVVNGLQRVRPGAKVEAKLVPMPTQTATNGPALVTNERQGGAGK
jgi:RND family efflux transporter MFP subunit